MNETVRITIFVDPFIAKDTDERAAISDGIVAETKR